MKALAEVLKGRFLGNSLGVRLIFWMVISSTLLSILAAGVQLYFSYQRDLSDTRKIFDTFEQSFHASLASALWEFNFQQIEGILDGVTANEDVIHVELTATSGHSIVREPEIADPTMITKSIALARTVPGGAKMHLGDLQIGITLAHLHERLWSQRAVPSLNVWQCRPACGKPRSERGQRKPNTIPFSQLLGASVVGPTASWHNPFSGLSSARTVAWAIVPGAGSDQAAKLLVRFC